MCSAAPEDLPTPDDRTTASRIRDAAITLFADAGVAAVSVRRVAAEAGVAPGSVLHHFGSKDGLRAACDAHVAATVRSRKSGAMSAGPDFDPLGALREMGDGPPLLRYLARTLVDGSPHVADLVDEIAADAEAYMAQGVDAGVLRPTEDGRGRAVVLTLWSLGALVLHEHLDRLLDVDLVRDRLDPAEASPYFRPALDIMGRGVLTDDAYARLRTVFAPPDGAQGKDGES